MRKVLVQDITNELNKHIQNKIEECIYCVHNQPLVFVSNQPAINEEEIIKNNIFVCYSQNFGGTIVAFNGDIDLAIFKYNGWKIGENFLILLKDKLSKYIDDITISGNDILIDNKYKVISFASINVGDKLIYTCVHISLNPNIELIDKICTKTMKKIPKGLSDYGLTTELIEEMLQELEI